MQELDCRADGVGLDEDGWALCYHLEGQMMEILSMDRGILASEGTTAVAA
jgi:hypothetical protein